MLGGDLDAVTLLESFAAYSSWLAHVSRKMVQVVALVRTVRHDRVEVGDGSAAPLARVTGRRQCQRSPPPSGIRLGAQCAH